MIICLNGEFVQAKTSSLESIDYKRWGVKDNLHIEGGEIYFLDKYLLRAKKSALIMGVSFPPIRRFQADIREIIHRSDLTEGSLKFFVWKNLKGGATCSLIATDPYYKHYSRSLLKRGMRIALGKYCVDEKDVFHKMKIMHGRFDSKRAFEAEYQAALKSGKDEVVFLNKNAEVVECSRSNIFFVKRGMIFTPSLSSGCFPGVIREVAMEIARRKKIDCRQGRFGLDDCLGAEEVFLTNSSMGIMPVSFFAGTRIPTLGKAKRWQILSQGLEERKGRAGRS